MNYKQKIIQQIKALREFERDRQNNRVETLKFSRLLEIKQMSKQVANFLTTLNNSPDLFGGKDEYREFINGHQDLFRGNRIPQISESDNYGIITVPEINYGAVLEALEEVIDEKKLEEVYNKCDPKMREVIHPLEGTINNIKKDVNTLIEDEYLKDELIESLDYANDELVEKVGENIVDNVIDIVSNVRSLEANEKFSDFLVEKGLDPEKIKNRAGTGANISAEFVNHPENFENFKPLLEMEETYSEDYKNKLLNLDELIKEEGLLKNPMLGESGTKEYGLVDYFQANYKLKKALTDYSTLTSDEEKRAKLEEINNLSNGVKEVTEKYDKVFRYIEDNFDLENVSLPGNLYSGRKGLEKNIDINTWKPNLNPKYDFEKSKAVVFLSGFMQLKGSASTANVSLKEYIDHPSKSFLKGAKELAIEDTNRLYPTRNEDKALGQRIARMMYFSSSAFAQIQRYSMAGGRGMEFLANTSPKDGNELGNTILYFVNKEYANIYQLSPEFLFGSTVSPYVNEFKNMFVAGDDVDRLFEVSTRYANDKGELAGVVKDYPQYVKRHGATPVDEEYKRVTKTLKDFFTEREMMNDNPDPFLKGPNDDFNQYKSGILFVAARQYFVDYLRENNLSLASVRDPKLREQIANFMADPVKTFNDKIYKIKNDGVENLNQIKREYHSVWNQQITKNNQSFFTKFNDFNNRPNGYNVGKSITTIISDNKGGWFERLRGKTSKEYTALQKVAKAATDRNSPTYGDKEAMYTCAKAYKAYKMPQGVTYEQLSKTAKKRIEFCDSIIKAYETDKREKEAANNPQPVVQNNNIIQDDFQNQLQNDIAPKQVKIINKVEDNKKSKNEEKDPPDNDDLEP